MGDFSNFKEAGGGLYTFDFTGTKGVDPADVLVTVGKVVLNDKTKITVGAGAAGTGSTVTFDKTKIKSGEIAKLLITLIDAKKQPVFGLGNDQFDLGGLVPKTTGTFGTVTEPINTTGKYSVDFKADKVGVGTITVKVDGIALAATATITVEAGPINGTTTTAKFATDTVAVKGTVVLTIMVKDTAGNPVGDIDPKKFVLGLTEGKGESKGKFGMVTESATKGTYTSTFTGATAGTPGTLTATVNGIMLTTTAKIQVQ
jgi:hypothetical protein